MVSSNVAKITCMILLWHSHASKLHMTKILRLTYLHFAPSLQPALCITAFVSTAGTNITFLIVLHQRIATKTA